MCKHLCPCLDALCIFPHSSLSIELVNNKFSLTCCSVRLPCCHPFLSPYPKNLRATISFPYSPKLFCFLFFMSNRICLLLGRSKTVTIGTLADMAGRWETCLLRAGGKRLGAREGNKDLQKETVRENQPSS